jgi:hypothetical protein
MTRDLYCITVVTDASKPEVQYLRRSAERCGITLQILISPGRIGHGYGFGNKLNCVKYYLDQVPEDAAVLCVDGYDVLFIRSIDDILQRFETVSGNGTNAVFSAESYCWPQDPQQCARYNKEFPSNQIYRFLNAGTWIGTARQMKILIRDFDGDVHIDDQDWFTKQYLDGGPIVLDTENQIFNCTTKREQDLQWTPLNGWYNNVTDSYPCIIHANGGKKEDYWFLFSVMGGFDDYPHPDFRVNRKLKHHDSVREFIFFFTVFFFVILSMAYVASKYLRRSRK